MLVPGLNVLTSVSVPKHDFPDPRAVEDVGALFVRVYGVVIGADAYPEPRATALDGASSVTVSVA